MSRPGAAPRPGAGAKKSMQVFAGSGILPDERVTARENVAVNDLRISGLALTDGAPMDEWAQPRRPGYGTKGTKITIYTNHFKLDFDRGTKLFRYTVAVRLAIGSSGTSQIRGKKLRRVVELFISEGPVRPLANSLATDFASQLLSPKEIPDSGLQGQVIYRNDEATTPPTEEDRQERYDVELIPDARNPFLAEQLLDHLNGSNPDYNGQEEMKQALNIILNHTPTSQNNQQMLSVGQRHFSLQPPQYNVASHANLQGGLEAIRGYYASVQLGAQRLLLNVQVKHAAVKQSGPLVQLMQAFGMRDKGALEDFLIGTRVQVDIEAAQKLAGVPLKTPKPNLTTKQAQVKTIVAFAQRGDRTRRSPANAPQMVQSNLQKGFGPHEVRFYLHNPPQGAARYITVKDYYMLTYGLPLSNLFPVVNVGIPEDAVYMPAEILIVRRGQIAKSTLNASQTKAMQAFAVRYPRENAKDIETAGRQNLGLTAQNQRLAVFGIRVNDRLLQVPARVLPPPSVIYANNRSLVPSNGKWNMDRINFMKSGTVPKKWGAVLVKVPGWRTVTLQEVDDAMLLFHREMVNCGVKFQTGCRIGANGQTIAGSPDVTVECTFNDANMRREIEAMMESSASDYGLVIWIMPDNVGTSRIYNEIKRASEVKTGLRTACVVGRRFIQRDKRTQGPDKQYYANIALKINLKFGGVNQTLSATTLGRFFSEPTMLVGLDVTHPSPGSQKKAPSIAAMVANTDRYFAQFPGVLKVQNDAREEMVDDHITDMLCSCFDRFAKANGGKLPRNVIIYRDGVSEGQYQLVARRELPAFRRAIMRYGDKTRNTKLSIIVCGKRHNTRFYPARSTEVDPGNENPLPGTVVDRGVTGLLNWEFFLQAQQAIQGTARPCHYFVVHDEIFRDADFLETFTHCFCYMYGRATKAVSYCPPAYYADKFCERGRAFLSRYYEPARSQAEKEDVPRDPESLRRLRASQQAEISLHPELADIMIYI